MYREGILEQRGQLKNEVYELVIRGARSDVDEKQTSACGFLFDCHLLKRQSGVQM